MRINEALVHLLSIGIGKLAPWLVFAYIAYLCHRTILVLAAGEVLVNPYVQLVANVNRARSFAFLLGLLGVMYGLVQRELRRRAQAKFEAKMHEFIEGRRPA